MKSSAMNYQSAVFLTSIVTLVLLDRFCDVMNPTAFTGIFGILVMVVASAFLKYQRAMQQRYRIRKDSSVHFSGIRKDSSASFSGIRRDPSVRSTRTSSSTTVSETSYGRGLSSFSDMEAFPPRARSFEAQCSELGDCSTWQEAYEIFQVLEEPNTQVYNSMLVTLTKANKTRLAVDLLHQMKANGIQPSPVGFHATLHICATSKEWQLGLALFRAKEEFGLEASSVTYGITINVMTKSNQPERAFELLEEMKHTVGPNGVALSAAMMACVPNKDWQRAIGFFNDLSKFGIEANIVSYGSIIDVLGKAGQWGLAMEFFNRMIQLNMRPNEVIYGSMVNFMAKAGQWRVALDTFYQMDRDVGANEIALNSAIRACSKDNQWMRAMKLLREFAARTPNMSIKAYVAMLDVLAQCNQYTTSLELFEEVLHKGYRPDMKSFNAVLSSFRALQWRTAIEFFGKHQSLGIYPNEISYQVLIKSLVIAKQRELAWGYFNQMVHNGIGPTSHLCDVMMRLCPHVQFRQLLSQLEHCPKSQRISYLPALESLFLSY